MAELGDSRLRRFLGWKIDSKLATHGIYVEIVVLALILALEGREASGANIVVAVLGALVALTLAELYAHYIGTMIGSGRRLTRDEFAPAVKSAAAGLLASLPPILLLTLGILGVIRLSTGFTAAKWAGALVIALLALYATRRAGLSAGRSLLTATLFLLVGAGLVLLKHYFH